MNASERSSRRLPPLAILVAALALAVFGLPSALNLPHSDPNQTLEYAPVPGASGAAGTGDFAALGLGSAGGQIPSQGLPPAAGASPTTKACVGTPPRQTEDPLSPPCVAFFAGDNGGATYPGVTGKEVRLLIYAEGGNNLSLEGKEPTDSLIDLERPPTGSEDVGTRMLRILQSGLNQRYQTYNRYVHFFIHYDAGNASRASVAERRADAASDLSRVHPFAVILYVAYQEAAYADSMAQHGVLVFVGSFAPYGAPLGELGSFFQAYPGLVWSFEPTMEQRGGMFAAAACAEIVGRSVAFSGNPADSGRPRSLGLYLNGDSGRPDLDAYGRYVRSGIEGCGGRFAAIHYYSDSLAGNRTSPAEIDLADFRTKGVTTLIVVGNDINYAYTHVAAQQGYFPEWILAGDGTNDSSAAGTDSDQVVMAHAFDLTTGVRRGPYGADPCFQIGRESDATATDFDLLAYYCGLYESVNQLFTGVQVAGPKLTPQQLALGFHAIPGVASPDPRTPACFYAGESDYACVKDAMAEWWDPSGEDPAGHGENGCWRALEGGARHLAGSWPQRELSAPKRATDECNAQSQL